MDIYHPITEIPAGQDLFTTSTLPVMPVDVFDENGVLVDRKVPAECEITDKRVQCDLFEPIDLSDPFAAAAYAEEMAKSQDTRVAMANLNGLSNFDIADACVESQNA